MCGLVEHRFGAHVGLSPKRYQSGEIDYDGGVSKCGDALLRRPRLDEALRLIDRRTVSQRYHCADPWGGHQPPAHRVGTNHVEEHLVQDGELLTHDPTDAEQRLD